jgi:drug/metabolite transporter (DMT)-like permease
MSRGPLHMILASAMFTVMVACVKLCRDEMSGLELVFWRGAISVPIVLATIRGAGFRLERPGVAALRIGFGLAAMSLFYTAAKGLPIVDLNLITRLQPILIALAAPLVLGPEERAGARTWLAAVGGLSGCALILAPGLTVGHLFGLAALAATFFSAGAHLSLRLAASHDHGRTIVFWFHVTMVAAAGTAIMVEQGGVPLPPRHLWPLVLGVGLSATAGQLLITRAYALGRAPVVAAASYAGVLWALVADILVFGLRPGWTVVIGGVLVLGGTSLTLGRFPYRRAPAQPR